MKSGIDVATMTLLTSVLDSSQVRKLFTTIASKRIAERTLLQAESPSAEQQLTALQDADLIGSAQSGEKYYVTAKGLKVARALEQLPAA